jgi:hypothetical protein
MGALIIPLFLFFQDTVQSSAQQSPAETQRREAALHSARSPWSRIKEHFYRMITFNLLMPQSFTNQPITASLVSEAPFS